MLILFFVIANQSLMDSNIASTSRNISRTLNNSHSSLTQKLTVPVAQDDDTESELLAIPLKDTEDDIEPPPKKKCSTEIMIPATQSFGEVSIKCTPAIARLKSTCSTPVASKSLIDNLKTPDTPYGQVFYDHPVSPETKKKWKKYVLTVN